MRSSRAQDFSAASISWLIGVVRALSRSGRLRVMVATPSETSKRIVSKDVGAVIIGIVD